MEIVCCPAHNNKMFDETLPEEWNMALAYMKRIDELLTVCSRAQIENNGLLWSRTLQALHKEVYPKLKPKERVEADKFKTAMLVEVQVSRKTKFIHTKFLLDYELYLRDKLEERSMLTPKPSDPRWAAANR